MEKVMARSLKSSLTSKGQATIPKEVRDFLKIGPGDSVKFFFHPDGYVAILPTVPVERLKGILKSKRKAPVTLEEMERAPKEMALRKYRRMNDRD